MLYTVSNDMVVIQTVYEHNQQSATYVSINKWVVAVVVVADFAEGKHWYILNSNFVVVVVVNYDPKIL